MQNFGLDFIQDLIHMTWFKNERGAKFKLTLSKTLKKRLDDDIRNRMSVTATSIIISGDAVEIDWKNFSGNFTKIILPSSDEILIEEGDKFCLEKL